MRAVRPKGRLCVKMGALGQIGGYTSGTPVIQCDVGSTAIGIGDLTPCVLLVEIQASDMREADTAIKCTAQNENPLRRYYMGFEGLHV